MRTVVTSIVLSTMFAGLAHAQTQTQPPNPTQQQVRPRSDVPLYRVVVVGHSTPAINYRYRSGERPIDFQGTALLPRAKGRAKVGTRRGFSDIDAHFGGLEPATRFGAEY